MQPHRTIADVLGHLDEEMRKPVKRPSFLPPPAKPKTAAIETTAKHRFTYIPLPSDIVDKLSSLQRTVAPDASERPDVDHVTLVYVKKTEEDLDQGHIDEVVHALRDVVEGTPPIHAKIQGWAYFDGAKKDGVDKTALVALLDAPGLEDLHVELKSALRSKDVAPSADHTFTPHITIAYLEQGKRVTDLPKIDGQFTIDKVCFANSDIHEMHLGEKRELKAASLAEAIRKLSR